MKVDMLPESRGNVPARAVAQRATVAIGRRTSRRRSLLRAECMRCLLPLTTGGTAKKHIPPFDGWSRHERHARNAFSEGTFFSAGASIRPCMFQGQRKV